jgi:adenylate kinase family enzyme
MSKPHFIIMLGANGSGKSTLGCELARALNFAHIDVEEYYFYQAEIPYTAMRPAEERNAMLLADMKRHGSFVMSGNISGWGEEFLTGFDLVIFLTAPTDIRLKRIENRENERWGDRVREGGDMYEQHLKFIEFAASRDITQLEQKASLYSCPILRVDSTKMLVEIVSEIIEYIKDI